LNARQEHQLKPEKNVSVTMSKSEMKVEKKIHKWGERVVITTKSGAVIEVLRFDSKGTEHSHELATENAECISGVGYIVINDIRYTVQVGTVMKIPAGLRHYMEPAPKCGSIPFTFLIKYEA